MFDPQHATKTPEKWEACKKVGMEHNQSVLQKLKAMLNGQLKLVCVWDLGWGLPRARNTLCCERVGDTAGR